MRSIARPSITAEVSYNTSISRVRSAELKARLKSIVGDIVAASDGFAVAAANGDVSSVESATSVGPVTAAELKAVYAQRFAHESAPGRVFYDRLRASAPNGKCPLCAHRDVATLDHFLPQALHPGLVVAPLNLVPACSDCNKAKLDKAPASPGAVTLHPYFDDVETDRWLSAEVIQTSPPSVRFWVSPPAQWPQVLSERVANHFRVFELAKLYASQAAEELVNIRGDLWRVFETAGPLGVTSHLTHMADSRAKAHVNSWQTATYTAFAGSSWFCAGGFAAA